MSASRKSSTKYLCLRFLAQEPGGWSTALEVRLDVERQNIDLALDRLTTTRHVRRKWRRGAAGDKPVPEYQIDPMIYAKGQRQRLWA